MLEINSVQDFVGHDYKEFSKQQFDSVDWSGIYPLVDNDGYIESIYDATTPDDDVIIVNSMFATVFTTQEQLETLCQTLLGEPLDITTKQEIWDMEKSNEQ